MAVTTPATSHGVHRAPRHPADRHPTALDALRNVVVLAASTGLTVAALVAISSVVARWG